MPKSVVWLIGDWRGRDFAAAAEWLAERSACRRFSSVDTALAQGARLQGQEPPQTAIIAQSRPGEFPPVELMRVRAEFPDVPLIVLCGPWCEGEHRPLHVPPGIARVSWRRWREGLTAEFSRPRPVITGSNGQDAKTIAAARLEEDLKRLRSRPCAGNAAVWASKRSSFTYLSDALRELGLQPQWLGGSGQFTGAADYFLYDGWDYVLPLPLNEVRNRALEKSVNRPKRLLLLHFPRPDDVLAARAVGIDAVLAKPVLLTDMASALGCVGPGINPAAVV
jgi:hypothetical protein